MPLIEFCLTYVRLDTQGEETEEVYHVHGQAGDVVDAVFGGAHAAAHEGIDLTGCVCKAKCVLVLPEAVAKDLAPIVRVNAGKRTPATQQEPPSGLH